MAIYYTTLQQSFDDLQAENERLRAELERYRENVHNKLASERDHYQYLAEQRYHLHEELFDALPTVDREADGDTQIQQAIAEITEMRRWVAEVADDTDHLKADAELGELVRRMGEGYSLYRVAKDFPLPGTWEVRLLDVPITHWHDDPEEALREALEGEEA